MTADVVAVNGRWDTLGCVVAARIFAGRLDH